MCWRSAIHGRFLSALSSESPILGSVELFELLGPVDQLRIVKASAWPTCLCTWRPGGIPSPFWKPWCCRTSEWYMLMRWNVDSSGNSKSVVEGVAGVDMVAHGDVRQFHSDDRNDGTIASSEWQTRDCAQPPKTMWDCWLPGDRTSQSYDTIVSSIWPMRWSAKTKDCGPGLPLPRTRLISELMKFPVVLPVLAVCLLGLTAVHANHVTPLAAMQMLQKWQEDLAKDAKKR